jgi:hypothetical protein
MRADFVSQSADISVSLSVAYRLFEATFDWLFIIDNSMYPRVEVPRLHIVYRDTEQPRVGQVIPLEEFNLKEAAKCLPDFAHAPVVV